MAENTGVPQIGAPLWDSHFEVTVATALQDGVQKLPNKEGHHRPPLKCVVKFYVPIIYDIYIPMPVQLMENEVLQ